MTALVRFPDQIAKLTPRLASDRDGEVVGTARAIDRTLKTAGLDFHAIAEVVGPGDPYGDALHSLDESPWGDIEGKPLNDRGLAVRLRPYGVKPKVVRIGDTTHRGYTREDFHDAWLRYLGPPPIGNVTPVTSETGKAWTA
jgi:hypothetical protein